MVLLAFTDDLFALNQLQISLNSLFIKLILVEISGCEYNSVVSSANKMISNDEVAIVISLTWRMNNSGPKIDP